MGDGPLPVLALYGSAALSLHSLSGWWTALVSRSPTPPLVSHEGVTDDCSAELREIIEQRDAVAWWRLVAALLAAVLLAFWLLALSVCCWAYQCIRCACRWPRRSEERESQWRRVSERHVSCLISS